MVNLWTNSLTNNFIYGKFFYKQPFIQKDDKENTAWNVLGNDKVKNVGIVGTLKFKFLMFSCWKLIHQQNIECNS